MHLSKLKRRWTELYYCFKYTDERLARAAALKAKYYHPNGNPRGSLFDTLNNEKKYKTELIALEKSFRDEESERTLLECRHILTVKYTEERFKKIEELKKKYAGPDGYFFGSVTTKGPHTKELEALEKSFAEEDRIERRATERDDTSDDSGFPDLNPFKHIFKFNVSEQLNDPEYQAKYSRSRTGTDAPCRENAEKTAPPQRRENPPPLPERKPTSANKTRPASAVVKSRNTVEVRDTAGNYVVSVGHGAASPIVGAYLNGDHVTVNYANGQVRLYDATSGHLIRTIS